MPASLLVDTAQQNICSKGPQHAYVKITVAAFRLVLREFANQWQQHLSSKSSDSKPEDKKSGAELDIAIQGMKSEQDTLAEIGYAEAPAEQKTKVTTHQARLS